MPVVMAGGVRSPGYPLDAADHPGYLDGGVYLLPSQIATAAALAAADLVYLWMWLPDAPVTVKSLGLRVSAAGTGSEMKCAAWANNPATMRPTGLPLRANNAGAPTVTGTQTVLQSIADWRPTPGVPVWLGVKQTGTLPTVVILAASAGEGARLWGGTGASSPGGTAAGLSVPDAYANDIAALDMTAASFTTVSAANGIPAWYMGT